MNTRCYAGIGSREMPHADYRRLQVYSSYLNSLGYQLRSGGADGADTAFATHAESAEILRPKDCTPEAEALAASIHPAWHNCTPYVRQLLGRNMQIILGHDLKDPVTFVLCWSLDPTQGGTSMGVNLALARNIPVFNLDAQSDETAFLEFTKTCLVPAFVSRTRSMPWAFTEQGNS